jgi:hypothetical protein
MTYDRALSKTSRRNNIAYCTGIMLERTIERYSDEVKKLEEEIA